MSETVCFIPARGGSKRLPKKNLAVFKGKTLVAHTIEQAIRSELFTDIILSSDNPEILSYGERYDIELHNRSEDLATDTIKIVDVLKELIKTRPVEDDAVICILLTTCPLRSVQDIISAFDLFKKSGGKHPVVSVKKNETPVQLSWKEINGKLHPVLPDEYFRSTRKQDHYDTYNYNDALIFNTASNFLKPSSNLFGEKPIPYVMPWERSIPIDYKFQLQICQYFGEMEEKNANH